MNRFFIITNSYKDKNLEITKELEMHLKNNRCVYSTSICEERAEKTSYKYTDPDTIPDDTQCIFVVGGDGTLLHAARDLVSKKIPMIGINCGKLGYLAEIDRNSIENTIQKLVEDDFHVESRMMLQGKLIRNGEEISESLALNDIIINRSGSLRILDFKVSINGQFLSVYSADGIIVSTPTGATAYNLSAGGPIAQPSSNIIIMTPICAHTLNSRSIVFDDDAIIELEICNEKNHDEEERFTAFDGDLKIELKPGDKIAISKSELYTNIIKLSSMSFLEVLRKKMS